MRWLSPLILTGCFTSTQTPVEAPRVEFHEVRGAWELSPDDEGKTRAVLVFDEHRLELGSIEGDCRPTSDLPFTEVQGQKAFAALLCPSPDGGTHHAVLVEVPGEDPEWPAPAALALVITRQTAEDKVALLTAGAVEVPLGILPLAPDVPVAPEPAADSDAE